MSLSGPLKRRITDPNRDLIDWLLSIENEEKRDAKYYDIGEHLERQGLPNKKISRVYIQLVAKPFVKLEKLTEAQILSFRCIGSGRTTPVSEVEDDNAVCNTDPDNNRSESDNECLQACYKSDTFKENEPRKIVTSNKTPDNIFILQKVKPKKNPVQLQEGILLTQNNTKDECSIQGLQESNVRQGLQEINAVQEPEESNDDQELGIEIQELQESNDIGKLQESNYNIELQQESNGNKELQESDATQELHESNVNKELQGSNNDIGELQESNTNKEMQESDANKEMQESDASQEPHLINTIEELQVSYVNKELNESNNIGALQESNNIGELQESNDNKELQVSNGNKELQVSNGNEELQVSNGNKELQESNATQELQLRNEIHALEAGNAIKELQEGYAIKKQQENNVIQILLVDNAIQDIQESNPVKELVKNTVVQPLNNLPVADNELKEFNVKGRFKVQGKSQNNTEDFNSKNNKIQTCNSLTTFDENKEINIEGRVSVIDKRLKDSVDNRDDVSSKDSKKVQQSVLKDKEIENNVKERKSVIEKPKGNSSLRIETDKERMVSSKNVSDKGKNSVLDQNINNEIGKNDICKQVNDQSLYKQLEIGSCSFGNLTTASSTEHGGKKEVSKEGKVSYLGKVSRTSDMKIKPTINMKEDLLRMKGLQERIAKNLSKKNIPLPCGSTNVLPGGDHTVSVLTAEKISKEKSQKPLISVRNNLFEHISDKTLKDLEGNAKQSKITSLIESNNDPGETIANINVGQQRFSGSSGLGYNKEKKRQRSEEEKSIPASYSEDSNNLKKLKQFNSELKTIKKIAESRKRVSQDSEEKLKTVKKRRSSEQSSRIRVPETCKQKSQHVEDYNKPFTQKKNTIEDQIPQEIPLRSVLDNNVKSHQAQLGYRSETNVDNKPSTLDPTQVVLSEGTRTSLTSSLKTQQKSNPPKSLNQTINNLHIRRQSLDSAQVLGINQLLENKPIIQPNISVGEINSVTDNRSCISENPVKNVANALSYSTTISDKGRMVLPHSSENRVGKEPLMVPVNNQSLFNQRATSLSATEQPQLASYSRNQVTAGRTEVNQYLAPEINRSIEKAIQVFLTHFCNWSNENLTSIPLEVRNSLNQYCYYSGRKNFSTVTEFLKLFMICYVNIFDNEDLRRKINKIAELLHLSIADIHRRKQRKEQATKLHSEVLRKEEISHAYKDYEETLSLRGGQFVEMFLSVLPIIYDIGCDYLMLVTLYFKITQALTKIDLENIDYVFNGRELMRQLLIHSKQSHMTSFSPDSCSLFKVEIEQFKSNYFFVKQCLFTLYISGYQEPERDNFFKLVNLTPTIPNIDHIIRQFSKQNSGTQTVESSNIPIRQVIDQMPITLESLLRGDSCPQTDFTVPFNVRLQKPGVETGPSQLNQAMNAQSTMGQQRTQNYTQPQGPMVRITQPQVQVSQRPRPMGGVTQSQVCQRPSPMGGVTQPQVCQRPSPMGGVTQPQVCQTQSPIGVDAQQQVYQRQSPLGRVGQQQVGQRQSSIGGDAQQQVYQRQRPMVGVTQQQMYQRQSPMGRVGQQQEQQGYQRQIPTVRVPSQLPPFASLNRTQFVPQNVAQRNLLASANTQANNQQLYHPANRGFQQTAKNNPSAPSQPQLIRQSSSSSNTAAASYHRPPPPYPGTTTNQLWQPGGNVNNAPSLAATSRGIVETAVQTSNFTPEEMMYSLPQLCTTTGCSKPATLICSLCRGAVYCTTDCQAKDWYKNHSNTCPASK